ncbi:unnamed protein product [Menidia menidia]|uniref:(Atlantic silverside) hypothetical protein n=1 Tax=Menidia menidia TaxID=238744 RepID=A0A8S4ATF1_9TELE|nr:unnamed protein product [Menidia menidia]
MPIHAVLGSHECYLKFTLSSATCPSAAFGLADGGCERGGWVGVDRPTPLSSNLSASHKHMAISDASTLVQSCSSVNTSLIVVSLKRSFEVEEADTSAHQSPLSRRTTSSLRSSTSSGSSQRSYDLSSRNSDYSSSRSSPSEPSNLRSPKTGMRRIELSGVRNPDAASSRRTEMSIEVTSKQVDNSPSAGIARFGLKRPEVSLSSRSNPLDSTSNSISSSVHRRAELSMTRSQEPPAPPRRMESQLSSAPASRIPEPPQRRAEPPSPNLSPVEAVSRRPEVPAFRQLDGLVPGSALENSHHPPPAPSVPPPAEPRMERVQSPVTEPPISRPTDTELAEGGPTRKKPGKHEEQIGGGET